MKDSLFRKEELSDVGLPPGVQFIGVEGILTNIGFHPGRLESHREEVKEILNEMSLDFHQKGGGGMSFLNLCMDKNERQWGEHRDMEALCLLAIGLKLAKWSMPRDMWATLPGAMPYVVFNTEVGVGE